MGNRKRGKEVSTKKKRSFGGEERIGREGKVSAGIGIQKGEFRQRRGNRKGGCFFGNRKRGPRFQRRRGFGNKKGSSVERRESEKRKEVSAEKRKTEERKKVSEEIGIRKGGSFGGEGKFGGDEGIGRRDVSLGAGTEEGSSVERMELEKRKGVLAEKRELEGRKKV
jgi:hypothetical protein